MTTAACGVGVAKVKKVVLSCFQASLLNLYNVRTKVRCANAPFRSEKELPLPSLLNTSVIEQCVDERLAQIFEDDDEERYLALSFPSLSLCSCSLDCSPLVFYIEWLVVSSVYTSNLLGV